MSVFRFNTAIKLAKSYSQQNRIKVCSNIHWGNKQIINNIAAHRFVSTVDAKTIQKEDSFIQKALKKITFIAVEKTKIKGTAYFLYEEIVDKINYVQIFEEFDLPDTFYSWFVITELHIWMMSVRAMAEDVEGRHLRNCLVEALWSDVAQRVKKIGAGSTVEMREHIFELSEQLQASLIAYDEGLQSNDVVLAGALWRRLYQMGPVDVKFLEGLVKYIRKQIRILDGYSRHQIFEEKKIHWEPVK